MNLTVIFSLGLALQASTTRLPSMLADIHAPLFGQLTQFWAQQAAGIPEGHLFIRALEHENFSFATAHLGVMDVGFNLASLSTRVRLAPQLRSQLANSEAEADDNNTLAKIFPPPLRNFLLDHHARRPNKYRHKRHGDAIVYLLASDTPASTSLKGEIALLLPFPQQDSIATEKKLHELIATLPLPPITNYAMSFGETDRWSTEVASIVESITEKTILVTEAGNNAPEPIEAGKQALAQHLIIVGSADPTGHVSSFSQRGCAETIRACSDYYIQNNSPKSGELFNFGGTSSATTLVSAALADTMSILPNLSREQAVLLLQNTALPNSYGDKVGLLNYYKLLRVAHRLAEQGWSATAKSSKVLHDASLYDFRAEAEQLTQEAITSPSATTAFLKLRRAFFLDPDNSSTRTSLAKIYRQYGYEAQAFFYDNRSHLSDEI